jgi:hypothetical protein
MSGYDLKLEIKMIDKHIEDSLDKIRLIFQKASSRIEKIKPGDKIAATELANELAAEHGMKGPSLYPTLLFLIKGYPGVVVKRGAKGGICRPLPGEVEKVDEPDDSKDES